MHTQGSRIGMLERMKVRRNERRDVIYLDYLARRRTRNPLRRLFQWALYQMIGEKRRATDNDSEKRRSGGPFNDHAW